MTAEWYKDCFDDSYIDLERLRYPASLNERQALGIARLLGMRRGGRWCDVCCGYGRHLLPLLRRGYDVAGIDLSSPMLRSLEQDARREGLLPATFQADIRNIPFSDRFHGAYLAGTSFGVFNDPADDLKALRSLHRSLKPGGRLLIDQANPAFAFSAAGSERKVFQLQSQQVEEETARDESNRRLVIRRTLRRGSWTRRWTMSFRIYDAVSLSQVLEKAGFAPKALYGDFTGGPQLPSRPRLIVVATCIKQT